MNPTESAAAVLESPVDLKRLLENARTIAVVGLSEKPERDSHAVAAYLQSRGYRIIGVHPSAKELLGEPAYPSLTAMDPKTRDAVDLVAIFRRPDDVPAVMEEAAALGRKAIWLPSGASSPAALETARRLGLTLVADKCLRSVHSVLFRG
jgi:predicted CoA-binding protein